jgi:hypothetical protein
VGLRECGTEGMWDCETGTEAVGLRGCGTVRLGLRQWD